MNNSENKSAAHETLVLMLKLGIICIIVSGLLAVVNKITSPIISANDKKNFEQSMSEVLDCEKFEESKIDYTPSESGVELSSIYIGKDGDKTVGYVATAVCHEGYGGDVTVMVGINKSDREKSKVKSVKIMSMSETAGLGARANEPDFTNQYSGLSDGIGVEKNNGGNAANNTISAISGATVTSKAVTKAVNCALGAADGLENGGADK